MEKIKIDRLKTSFLKATITSEKMIIRIANTVKEAPTSIPPIDVGVIDDEYYIIDGHARVEAFKRAGLSYIQAKIHKLKSKDDVIINHIRYNKHSAFNPIILYEAIKDENDIFKAAKKYWLDVEEIKAVLAIAKLGEEAYNSLKMYIEILSKRFDNVYIPPYIIRTLAKIPIEYQKDVVDYIFINIDRPENRFSFPEEDSILAFASYYRRNTTKSSRALINEERKGSIESKDLALIKCHRCNALYAINKKRSTISIVEINNNLLTIKGDLSKRVYAIPPDIAEEFENDGSINWFLAHSKEEALSIINQIDSKKFLILACEE